MTQIPVDQEALGALALVAVVYQDITHADVTMKDMGIEVGMLLWKPGVSHMVKVRKDVLASMASAMALTNSHEKLNEINDRATTLSVIGT